MCGFGMCGFGFGWPLMILMMLLWIVLIAVIVWAIIRLVQYFAQHRDGERGWHGRETPQEILDRRFASGEINAEEYRQARDHLSGRGPRS